MTSTSRLALLLALLSPTAALAQDAQGCKDHPLLTRIPGYFIASCETPEFGEAVFQTDDGDKPVSGKLTRLEYRRDVNHKPSSAAFIGKNVIAALQKLGAKKRFENPGAGGATLVVAKGDAEVWVSVAGYFGEGTPEATDAYVTVIVERGQMKQVITATDILDEIERTGRAALYVQFDTNRAVIKPESQPLVAQMAELLEKNPRLRVYVVGHTDAEGKLDDNLKLSEARAAAVARALIEQGIAANRLVPRGVGPLSPIASNAAEAGRKLNRRVELVRF